MSIYYPSSHNHAMDKSAGKKNSGDRLEVFTLGRFTVRRGGVTLSDDYRRSARLWNLFNYLLIHRGKHLPPEELIEVIWPDHAEVNNPEHALRNLVYRLRRLIGKGGSGQKQGQYIVFSQGGYGWETGLNYWLDAEEFVTLCRQGSELAGQDAVDAAAFFRKAFSLYRGDYLAEFSYHEWVIPLRNYYRRLFLEAVLKLSEILKSERLFGEVAAICEQALLAEPFEEELHRCFIEALLEDGKPGQARSHYEYVTSAFYRQMGARPSPAMRALYRRIRAVEGGVETDLNVLLESLREREKTGGALRCDPEVFRYFYKLEERRAARARQKVFLGLLTLAPVAGGGLEHEASAVGMKLLEKVLRDSLRKGDVICRWNKEQHLILLPGLDRVQAARVLARVEERFGSRKPPPGLAVQWKVQPITPPETAHR